jgi:hypothetical protein
MSEAGRSEEKSAAALRGVDLLRSSSCFDNACNPRRRRQTLVGNNPANGKLGPDVIRTEQLPRVQPSDVFVHEGKPARTFLDWAITPNFRMIGFDAQPEHSILVNAAIDPMQTIGIAAPIQKVRKAGAHRGSGVVFCCPSVTPVAGAIHREKQPSSIRAVLGRGQMLAAYAASDDRESP